MTKANEYQVAGNHYREGNGIQHWDFAASQQFDYFQGQITKYITRWKKKNGMADLEKAKHFLEKYIEVEKMKSQPGSAIAQRDSIATIGSGRVLPPIPSVSSHGQEHPFGYDAQQEGVKYNIPPQHNED